CPDRPMRSRVPASRLGQAARIAVRRVVGFTRLGERTVPYRAAGRAAEGSMVRAVQPVPGWAAGRESLRLWLGAVRAGPARERLGRRPRLVARVAVCELRSVRRHLPDRVPPGR